MNARQSILLALTIIAGGTTFAPKPAQAVVWCTVYPCATEPTQLQNNLQLAMKYVKQGQEYTKQLEQLQTEINRYRQMAVRGQAFLGKPGFREDVAERFPERDINEGVHEACGARAKNNPVGDDQHKYCVAIVQTQNRRYNAMVKVLKDVGERDKQLDDARKERAALSGEQDQGALQANTNRTLAIRSQLENDIQNAKTTVDAYNALLVSLNESMVRSANAALKNKNSLLDTAVQGTALKLALRGARLRDR